PSASTRATATSCSSEPRSRPARPPDRSVDAREELSLAGHRRSAVDEEDELLVARVPELEDRPGLGDEDAAARDLVALGGVAEVDRERPVEHDEDLLLGQVLVALAPCARRVAPEVRAGLCQRVGEAGDRTRVVLGPSLPLDLGLAEDRESHRSEYPGFASLRVSAGD